MMPLNDRAAIRQQADGAPAVLVELDDHAVALGDAALAIKDVVDSAAVRAQHVAKLDEAGAVLRASLDEVVD
jgi:hypothetical protein